MASPMGIYSEAEWKFEAENWKAARDKFKRAHTNQKALDEFLGDQGTPEDAKTYCLEKQKQAEKQYAPALGDILYKVENLMKVGDLAMQSAPESVGLVWCGIRLCLHSFEDDFATFNLFSGAASDIVGILISCRLYGKMWGGHKGPEEFQEMHKKVVEYIPDIYTHILEFSYQMKKHMGRSTGVRMVRGLLAPTSAKFKPMINDIKMRDQEMAGFAKKANDQLSTYYQETGLHNQEAMMSDLSTIRKMLESSMEVNEIFIAQIRRNQAEMKDMRKKTPFDKAKEVYDANVNVLGPPAATKAVFEKNLQKREALTCNWIFGLEQYTAWRSSTVGSLLWVSGVGGMGKSILISAVIETLQKDFSNSKDHDVQYFFCSSGDESTQTAGRINDQLLCQLYQIAFTRESADVIDRANEIVSSYISSHKASDAKSGAQQKKSEKTVGFEEAYRKLAQTLDKKVFLIVDALDECSDRQATLKSLQGTLSPSDDQVKIIICSRPGLREYLRGSPTISIGDHNGPDIELAAKAKLEGVPGLDDNDRSMACRAIVGKANGLIRCVDPAIEFLKKPWRRPLEQRLSKLPNGLDDSYQQTLNQTDPDYLELLSVSLTWTIICARKPTIAEVMDDYSRAYVNCAEGDRQNPWDNMEDSLKTQIREQIRTAGGNTFLEVTDDTLSVRHPTVNDFFEKSEPLSHTSDGHCVDNLCPRCKLKAAADRPLRVSKKDGQLHMAITILRHLNSPLFQRRYLFQENNKETVPDTTTLATPQTDGIPASNPELIVQDAVIHSSNEPAQEPAPETSPIPPVSSQGSEVTSTEQAYAPTGTTESSHPMEGPITGDDAAVQSKLQDALQVPAAHQDNPSGEIIANQTPIEQPSPVPENPDVEPHPESDEEDDEEDIDDARPPQISDEELFKSERYELVYWLNHLRSAEELWTPEEQENNDDWKELWQLVVQFMCQSQNAFQAWQSHYIDDRWEDETTNGLSKSWTPLQVASAYNLTSLAKMLIQRGEPVNAELKDGRSALWFAANQEIINVDLIRLLLAHGANPNSYKDCPPPFHMLLWRNHDLDAVKLMLEYQADCTIVDPSGFNCMHYFGMEGKDPAILTALLEAHGDINVEDQWREAPLHRLMYRADASLELLDAFLKSGADVNKEDRDSQMPLYGACCLGNTEAAKVLLDHGADIHDPDLSGLTAAHVAAGWGNLATLRLLAERNAVLDVADHEGRTPFFSACSEGNLETVKFLYLTIGEHGPRKINIPAKNGRTPFSKAAGRGHTEIVRFLLAEEGLNTAVDATETDKKRTALHWAAYNGKADVVDLLLEYGADATIADDNGHTALTLCGQGWANHKAGDQDRIIMALIDHDRNTAAKDANLMATSAIKGNTRVIEKLLDARAHPNQQDDHGWTPLQLARQYGHSEVASLLARRGAEVGSRPSRWVTKKKEIKVSEIGCELEFVGDRKDTMILADHPVPAGIEYFYYEVEIKTHMKGSLHPIIAIGFATQPARLDKIPGWFNAAAPSFAFHGDDGRLFFENHDYAIRHYGGGPFGQGDKIGCGVIYQNGIDGTTFYTRNGVPQGPAFEKDVKGRLYPAIGMAEPAITLVNFGSDIEKRPFVWEVANSGIFDLEAIKPQADSGKSKTG